VRCKTRSRSSGSLGALLSSPALDVRLNDCALQVLQEGGGEPRGPAQAAARTICKNTADAWQHASPPPAPGAHSSVDPSHKARSPHEVLSLSTTRTESPLAPRP